MKHETNTKGVRSLCFDEIVVWWATRQISRLGSTCLDAEFHSPFTIGADLDEWTMEGLKLVAALVCVSQDGSEVIKLDRMFSKSRFFQARDSLKGKHVRVKGVCHKHQGEKKRERERERERRSREGEKERRKKFGSR